MIGLHHQMSYSPAAVAAAQYGDRALAKSVGGRSKSKAMISLERTSQPQARKQRSLALEDMPKSNRSAQSRSREELQPQLQRRSREGQMIVQVPARTAQQIFVDSLPSKCRAGSQPRLGRDQQQSSGRHFLLQQQRELVATDELAATNQVLLIMSDDHKTAGSGQGVAVVGRRLPSKSYPHHYRPTAPATAQQVGVMAGDPADRAPVIGRRSHRILKQQLLEEQQQAGASAAAECHSFSAPSSHPLEGPYEVFEHDSNQYAIAQQANASKHKRQGAQKAAAMRRARALNSASSCSSVCSPPPLQACRDLCCQPPRVPPAPPLESARCKAECAPEPSHLLVSVCALPGCCSPLTTGGGQPAHQRREAPSDQQRRHQVDDYCESRDYAPDSLRATHHYHDTCQANGSLEPQHARRSGSRHHTLAGPGQLPPPVPSKPTLSSQSLLLGNHPADRHHQHNPTGAALSLDENEQVTQMYESLAAELKAKLGNPNRAPILLPPKDYDTLSRQQGKLTGIELRRSTNPQLVGPNGLLRSASGASEGRAPAASASTRKPQGECDTRRSSGLGTPAAKQSPSSSSTSSGSQRKHHATDVSPSSSLSPGCPEPTHECGSARSSGRGSQSAAGTLDESLPSRSRSNSSSGLGSISLGGGQSPDSAADAPTSSSKSSSSEDMRQASGTSCVPDERRGKGIENHNPSKVSGGVLWNGRVEVPLKVNSERLNGNTYLATKQIIY